MQQGEPGQEREWEPAESQAEASALGEESDFGDSFLEEVARVEPPPPTRRLVPGDRLGGRDGRRFEVLKELGEGAMGQVVRARDEELRRVVALKCLFPREELAGLALREAQAIAQLDHENIVRIFDAFEWGGAPGQPPTPVLVMECLEGESLAAVLRRERLEPWRALEILGGVAAGLAQAHERHLVHRDLKPSNVFLTPEGQVKLLDFGLAWLASSTGPTVPHLPTAGTPPYMAPEQWRGERVDARTDLWAAGVLLYEMLTGELPYRSVHLEELRAQVLSPEPVPPLRARRPDLPWELEALLSVLLQKDPARRLLTAAELGEELRELREHLRPGNARGRSAVGPQRRQVTLVACRLAGLTALGEELDPEDFGELEAAFHRSASEVLQRHGGFVVLCMGDEVLGCFGYPVAHEGDSEHAVQAGLTLGEAVHGALREKLPPGTPSALAVQVGIHTDLVVLDDILPELRGQTPSIQGEAPRVATWLARQAAPDAVVLGPTTHSLVQRAFDTEPLGPLTLEGTRRLEVHRVVRAREATIRFERALAGGEGLTPLVGRERELETLLGLWRRALEGQRTCVLLRGEAGIGKSRLVQEVRERVVPDKPLRLRLQCWSESSASAFHPVVELLRRLWLSPERSPEENLRELEARLRAWGLGPMRVRLLAVLLGLPVREDSPHLRLTPERQKAETLEALATLLALLARERPVLGVVEDLHWADPSTLELLAFLLAREEPGRVLLVLTARPEFHPPWGERPGFSTLALERLPASCTERLAREVARGRALPEEALAQLVARTDGIPLFVEEMTRAVVEHDTPGSIPVTLQELLLARLDSLPRRQKALVQLCAVMGRGFSHALLALLTQQGDASLRRDLMGLAAAGLVQRQDEEAEPGYQFRHALLQEAAYQSLPRGARRQHHLHIAQVLEAHFPEVAERRPELLAHHYMEAGVVKPAIRYWKQAGLRASLSSANQEAVSHLNQALKLLRSLPDAATLSHEELQLLIALGVPLSQVEGYRSPEVERTYTRATELFRLVGDELPRLELSFWGSFAYYFARGKTQEAHQVAELLVDLGQRQRNRELLSLGYRMMATDCFNWGRMGKALEHLERAMEYSDFDLEEHRRLAVRHWVDPRVAAQAYGTLILSVVGEEARAERFTHESLELAGRIGHAHTMAYALTYCALGAQLRGDAQTTLVLAEQGIELSSEHRFRLWLLWSSALRAWALAEVGRPQEGLLGLRRVLELWKQSGIQAGMPHNLGMLAQIHLRLGQVHEGLEAVEEALPLPAATGERSYEPELHRMRGELLRLEGREEEARGELLEAIHLAHENGMYGYERRAREALAKQLQQPGLGEGAAPLHP